MSNEFFITLAVQLTGLVIAGFVARVGRTDKQEKSHEEELKAQRLELEKELTAERLQTERWRVDQEKIRIEQEKVGNERHKDNKDLIHSLTNQVHSILLTVTAFDAWKMGHELRDNEHYARIESGIKCLREECSESFEKFRTAIGEIK